MPIDKVTRKRRETTTGEHISVVEKNPEGKSYREIVEIAGISKSQEATTINPDDLPSFLIVMSTILKCFLIKIHLDH
jgi:hypothetical protein